MGEFEIGDAVEVLDEGLAMLREFMGHRAKPNHHGTVKRIMDNGDILVEFPIGDDDPEEHSQVAPYPLELVRKREA